MNNKTIAGTWKGFYSYSSPDNLSDFTLVIESPIGNSIVGTILEKGHDKPLEIAGLLNFPMLRFSKVSTNNQSVRYFEPFEFEGFLSSDCIHVSGFWTNASARGDWSGDKEDTLGAQTSASKPVRASVPVDDEGVPWSLIPGPVKGELRPADSDESSESSETDRATSEDVLQRLLSIEAKNSAYKVDPVGNEIQLLNKMRIEPRLNAGTAGQGPKTANMPESAPAEALASSALSPLTLPSPEPETRHPALIAPVSAAQKVLSSAAVPAPAASQLSSGTPESRCPRCGAERGTFAFCIACGHSFELSS